MMLLLMDLIVLELAVAAAIVVCGGIRGRNLVIGSSIVLDLLIL